MHEMKTPEYQLTEINALAATYFRRMFEHHQPARTYCARRGIGHNLAERFTIGYAPDEWHGLTNFLRQKGIDPSLAHGLVRKSENGWFDIFRGRIILPVRDAKGTVLGFVGRSIADTTKLRYLNSQTTPIFSKGKVLFGIHLLPPTIQTIVIVEGALDCILFHGAGQIGTLATLGSSISIEQTALLCNAKPKRIVLLFDGDLAGQTAARNALDILQTTGAADELAIAILPEKSDPASFALEHGPMTVRKLIENAIPAATFVLRNVLKQKAEPPVLALQAEQAIRRFAVKGQDNQLRILAAKRLLK
jgi:DNA primase